MPITPRPHLAWLVRLVPLAGALVVLAFFLLYPPTSAGTRANIAKWWSGESARGYRPVTRLIREPCSAPYSICSKVAELADEPRTRAVVERRLPGIWTNPAVVELRAYELRMALTRLEVPPEVQQAIDEDLESVMPIDRPVGFNATQ